MMGHKICFDGEIWLIIPKLSLLLLLIWSTVIKIIIVIKSAGTKIRVATYHHFKIP